MKKLFKLYFVLASITLRDNLYYLRGSIPEFLREFFMSVASIIGILILPITSLVGAVKNYNNPKVDWAGVEKKWSGWFKKDKENS